MLKNSIGIFIWVTSKNEPKYNDKKYIKKPNLKKMRKNN